MEIKFEKQGFAKKLKTMLKVDFKRMFTTPLIYIMTAVCLVIPILILVMTTSFGASSVDPSAGEEVVSEGFTNVWQTLGSVSGTQAGMDLTGMCNINMIYFLIAIFVCVFVTEDFKCGYAKNIFAVRAKRTDYCISKSLAGFVGGAIMIVAYFIGALLGGAIGGLSFDAGEAGAGGIVACLISKVFLVFIFVSISLVLSVTAKQRRWIAVLGSLVAGMLLFTMLPIISPLDSGAVNVIMCLVGGALFAVGLGAVSNAVLRKRGIV